jgi:hypothetical protein
MDDLCDTVYCNFPSSLILIIYTPHNLHSLPFLLSSAFLVHTSSRCACGPLRSLVTTDVMNKSTAMSQGGKIDMAGGESSSSSTPLGGEARVSHDEDSYRPHAEHGPPIDNQSAAKQYEEDYKRQSNLWWSRMRHHFRDPAAEFFGTFTMIIFGDGSVAQVLLSQNPNLPQASQNKGGYQSISWG